MKTWLVVAGGYLSRVDASGPAEAARAAAPYVVFPADVDDLDAQVFELARPTRLTIRRDFEIEAETP